jgi:hypothetical protein
MTKRCTHLGGIRDVTPSALGCEECLKLGSAWLHLRICRSCGHVGCCDDSPHKHATQHFHATGLRSSKATIRRRDGAGAMSIGSRSICRIARPRITVQSRATIEAIFNTKILEVRRKASRIIL